MALRKQDWGLSTKELAARRDAVLEVVQREGLPDIIGRCRSGTDAEKEKAAELIAYLAYNDGQCAGFIVAAGGIPPLIAMLHAEDGRGDDDPRFDMKEVAVKALHALCEGDPSNQLPIAERGAIPPMLKILTEDHHPWSIREAAANAIALLAYEPCGGPAQEMITDAGGVHRMVAVYREPECTEVCKTGIAKALRFMAVYKPAKLEMKEMGILAPREQDPNSDVHMAGLELPQTA
jgi:hypothetical protein